MISRAKGIDSVGEIGVRVCGVAGGSWGMGTGGDRGRSGVRAFKFLFWGGGGLRLHTGLHAMIPNDSRHRHTHFASWLSMAEGRREMDSLSCGLAPALRNIGGGCSPNGEPGEKRRVPVGQRKK